jgi:tol-pal system protein YbgF
MKSAGRRTGACTSLCSANRSLQYARARRAAVLVLSWAAASGCATRADLLQVKQDQREVRALLADQQVAIEGLRRRLEILRSEISEPRRGRGGAGGSAQTQQLLGELEARVAAIEQARAITPPPPLGRPLETFEAEGPLPTPTPRTLSPQEIALAKEENALQAAHVDGDYREALQLIRQGQCNQAAPKLRDFIRKNPKSDLADNAQYWIGACYYGQRDYNQAIKELSDVMLKYSKGDKAPSALLMLADAFADSGDKIDARLVLKKLTSDYPRSEEAERARQKLQSLGE